MGVFYYANGSTYEGEWKAGKKHGYGVFIDENGKANYAYYLKDRVERKILISNTLLETLIKADNKRKDTFIEYSRDSNLVNSPIKPFRSQANRVRSTNPRLTTNNLNNDALNTRTNPPQNRNQSDIVNETNNNLNQEVNGGRTEVEETSKVENEDSNIGKRETNNTQHDEVMEIFTTIEKSDSILKMSPEEIEEFRKKNLYFDILKINDFITDEGRRRIQVRLCETLLRHHSDLKRWYKIYAMRNKKQYEEGFFMSFSSLVQLLIDTRLLNGRLNEANLGRILTGYGERDFELYYIEQSVKNKIDLMKRYDFNKPKQISQATLSYDGNGDEVGEVLKKKNTSISISQKARILSNYEKNSFSLETGNNISFEQKIKQILVDKYETKKSRNMSAVNPDKVILMRGFVNALVRAVHLKTGSINKLPEKVHSLFTERINPIISGKIRPKPIIGDDSAILKRSSKISILYDAQLRELYEMSKSLKCMYIKGDFLDLKSFMNIMIVRASIVIF